MKNTLIATIITGASCALIATSLLIAQADQDPGNRSQTIEYAVKELVNPTLPDEEKLLNSMAANGWGLVTVSVVPPWESTMARKTYTEPVRRFYFSRTTKA